MDDPQKATARTVDGLRFPDWRRYSWTPVGGRHDRLAANRDAATVVYRKGAQTITYTIVSGTGNVHDETITQTQEAVVRGKKIALVQAATAGVLTLKRKRNGRTIVMTGKPPDRMRDPTPLNDQHGLARTMRRLAVRGLG